MTDNKSDNVNSVMTKFHVVANSPPIEDPTTKAGVQAWHEWAELCRGFEAELREAGVNL